MIYVLGAFALVAVLAGGWGAWQQHSRETAEANLKTCETRIESQNDAIEATKKDGDRRVAAATKGVAKATQETKAARTEAERLRGLAGAASTPGKPSSCPAGDAVGEIRKGLQ